MKSSILISLCLVFLCSCQELPIEEYAVIPQPAEIAYASGFVKLKSQPVVAYPSELANEAQLLQSYLSSDFSVGAVLNEGGGKADITLQLDPTVLPDKKEGYVLDAISGKVMIKANSPAGILNGVQTLRQVIKEKDGKLITSPGTSPENKFLTPDGYAGATSYGCTSDLAMTRECLIDAAKAAEALGTDKTFRKQIEKTLPRLLPYQVGKKGNLQEWFHDWEDQEPQHRHQSHLFGLYPGHHLSVKETPELAKACACTLEIKGDNTTGWSTGWRVNLYARLQDSKNAYHIYRRLLRYVSPDGYKGKDARRGGGTYPNLLDAHSPFQIDGNFGGCAGVIEMLMQSSENSITLLPALPEEWKDGSVKGICARGGFIVDMEWKDNKVTSLYIQSRKGGKTKVCFNGKVKNITLKGGKGIKLL